MYTLRFLPLVLCISACTVANNPSQPGPTGTAKIELVEGRNCWNNQCLRFSRVNRSVSVIGRHPVRIPRDIDVRDSQVTEAEFAEMFQTANMAFSTGAGRR